MGRTLAEKILARAAGRERVQPGEFVTAQVDLAMTNDIFAAQVFGHLVDAGVERVFDPERVVVVLDHLVPAPSEAAASAHRKIREYVEQFGVRHFYEAGQGICHQLLPEQGHVAPGALVVGTDSHTTTHGALAAAGAGIADRLTVCNMAVEIGAKFGFFAADETTLSYLAERGLEGLGPLAPDADASYVAVHELALDNLEPQAALPPAV